MKNLSLLIAVVLCVLFTSAQDRSCGTMQYLNEIRQNNPKIHVRMANENKAIKTTVKSGRNGPVINVIGNKIKDIFIKYNV